MAKTTKTWKIGEYCKGGIITVEINRNEVNIIGKDWDTSAGYKKTSNQSKAKEWTRITADVKSINAYHKCDDFLHDLTTSYYADEILTWIKSKVKFELEY